MVGKIQSEAGIRQIHKPPQAGMYSPWSTGTRAHKQISLETVWSLHLLMSLLSRQAWPVGPTSDLALRIPAPSF